MNCPNCGYLNTSGPYCDICETLISAEKEEKKPSRPKPRSKKNKASHDAEKSMREEIWKERPPFSCIYHEYLGEEPEPYMFGHVLCKQVYPELRLHKRNIVLFSWEEHQMWDQGEHSKLGQEWDWIKMYAEMLKQQVYGQ